MPSKRLDIHRILISLFLISLFLLSLTKVYDYDSWFHLSLGRIIWELKGIPDREPFLYTMYDQPFAHGSWFFGFIYYLAYKLFDTYGIILLKASTITLAFYILLKDSLMEVRKNARAEVSLTQTLIAIMVLSIMVLISRYRFVERPDTFLMVFLPFSIYSLNAYVYHDKRYIYSLPLIHMLWANSHSSINLMIVPFGAFLIGGLLSRLLDNTAVSYKQLKSILIVFIASFIASTVSPYSIGQFIGGVQVLATDWYKHEIMELQPPTWKEWKSPYLITALLISSFMFKWFVWFKRKEKDFKDIGRDITYLLLVLPFIYLSFTAVRFIFILAIVSGPILVRNISSITEGIKNVELINKPYVLRIISLLMILWIAFYTYNVIDQKRSLNIYGFGFSDWLVPEGALKYLDKRNITGRLFNSFGIGHYINWRDYPKRAVFIDGRGYLSPELLEAYLLAPYDTLLMDELQRRYGFEVLVLSYPIVRATSDVSISAHGWALVYWDDNSMVYLRRGGIYDHIINEDEYKYVRPAWDISYALSRLHEQGYADSIIRELKRNISETGSSRAYVYLGEIYNEMRFYERALESLRNFRDFGNQSFNASFYTAMGTAYWGIGDAQSALNYFKKAYSTSRSTITLYNLGIAYILSGERERGIKYLKEAKELNPKSPLPYPELISYYNDKGKKEEADRLTEIYEDIQKEQKAREYLNIAINAYNEARIEKAIENLRISIHLKQIPEALYKLGNIYYFKDNLDEAFYYLKAALELSPDYAEAHYNLAFVYKKWERYELAEKHFMEYLRIMPQGYYSRIAKKELEGLKER